MILQARVIDAPHHHDREDLARAIASRLDPKKRVPGERKTVMLLEYFTQSFARLAGHLSMSGRGQGCAASRWACVLRCRPRDSERRASSRPLDHRCCISQHRSSLWTKAGSMGRTERGCCAGPGTGLSPRHTYLPMCRESGPRRHTEIQHSRTSPFESKRDFRVCCRRAAFWLWSRGGRGRRRVSHRVSPHTLWCASCTIERNWQNQWQAAIADCLLRGARSVN